MPARSSHTIKVILAYLSVYLIWGSTYLAMRFGIYDIPPALLAGLRFFTAGSALFAFGFLRHRQLPADGRTLRILVMVGLFLLVGGNGMVVWSVQWVHTSVAALIIATVPLFMSSIDSLIPGGDKLSAFGWFGILLGFAGIAILVSPNIGLLEGDVSQPKGIAALIFASLSWSIGSVYSKRHKIGGDIIVNAGIQNLAAGLVLISIALATGEPTLVSLTPSGLIALLYLIVFGSIIGFTSYTFLLRHVPAAKASTYAYVNPMIAVILGVLVLSEPLDLRTVIATVVILGGVAIVQASKTKTR